MAYILIVDDDLDFSDAVATALRGAGHEVETEEDADRAVERLLERRPDVLVLDVMFPENPSAGFELARAIRRKLGELPILMLTAVNQHFPLGFSEKDIDPTWLPVTEFVEKPVDFGVLNERVEVLLQASAAGNSTP